MDGSIRDYFSVGPGISLTGLHIVPVSAVPISLVLTGERPMSSHGFSSGSGEGLSMTTGLLCTGWSHHSEVGFIAIGIAIAITIWVHFLGAGKFSTASVSKGPITHQSK